MGDGDRTAEKEVPSSFGTVIATIILVNIFSFQALLAALGTDSNAVGVAIVVAYPFLCIALELRVTPRLRRGCARCRTRCCRKGGGGGGATTKEGGARVAPAKPTFRSGLTADFRSAQEQAAASKAARDALALSIGRKWRRKAANAAAARLPPPQLFNPSEPDEAYLRQCGEAAAALRARLARAPRTVAGRVDEWLEEKHNLKWNKSGNKAVGTATRLVRAIRTSITGTAGDAPSVDSLLRAAGPLAKTLRALAMRYPRSALPLAQGAFAWCVPALRTRGPLAVARALRGWVDTTSSAADSSMFSSTGIWTSPFAVKLFGFIALLQAWVSTRSLNSEWLGIWPAFAVGSNLMTLGLLGATVALAAQRRELARWCFGLGAAGCSLACLAEATLVACTCAGVYRETHALPPGQAELDGREYPWEWSANVACLALAYAAACALSAYPSRSVAAFLVFPVFCFVGNVALAAAGFRRYGPSIAINCMAASVFSTVGVHMLVRRWGALAEARRMAADDAERYTKLWEGTLMRQDGFRVTLAALELAWDELQAGALVLPRRQTAPSSLFELLCAADRLNDPFHVHMHALGARCAGCRYGASPVKAEVRALQKVYRSYKGEWRCLNDLVRCSLVFDDAAEMVAALKAVHADPELEVVRTSGAKFRLRPTFDAEATGGYRDVQLAVRLNNAETRARGAHELLAEVQLHLRDVADLKSDGGHANYVLRRNLGGQ